MDNSPSFYYKVERFPPPLEESQRLGQVLSFFEYPCTIFQTGYKVLCGTNRITLLRFQRESFLICSAKIDIQIHCNYT